MASLRWQVSEALKVVFVFVDFPGIASEGYRGALPGGYYGALPGGYCGALHGCT